MKHQNDRYPWIRRQPGIPLDDLFLHATAGEDTGPARRFLKRWLRTVLRHASDPIRIEDSPEGRRVTCMGVLRVHVANAAGGHRTIIEDREWQWSEKLERYVPQWVVREEIAPPRPHRREPTLRIGLLNPWVLAAAAQWEQASPAVGASDVHERNRQLLRWSGQPAFQWIRAWIDEPALQRMLGHALGIRPVVVYLARKAWGYGCDDARVFSVIAAHRRWFMRLAVQAPTLLGIGESLLRLGVPLDPARDPAGAIRACLHPHGLTEGGWRLLQRTPDARERLQHLLINWSHPSDLVHWLNAHVRAGLDRLTHGRFESAVAGLTVWHDGTARHRLPESLFRLLAREALRAEARGGLVNWLAGEDWEAFERWYEHNPGFAPDTNQARAGWRWLCRHVEWQERERLVAQLAPQPYALREYRHDGLVAHALESVSELQEEGAAMHHCLQVAMFPGEPTLERFAEGALRFFSIRENGRGERVATLEIERCDDAG
ncbi:PcfJ domain-containing protein, partial [Thioalkalivibrio sp.]|uniref:PcfJ domain-containing protein n=1 Tax=Thioalkalivibrio sp. TaxID=2093813 RepID=UPI003975381C